MNKFKERKLQKLSEKITEFQTNIEDIQKVAIQNGKKSLEIGSKQQINFWVVQYKLTSEYIQQAKEMLGQLEIVRYSNNMQKTAKTFMSCMTSMASQLSKAFGYTNLDKISKAFDKQQVDLAEAREKNQDIMEETTERFKEMQESFQTYNNDIEISEIERNHIIDVFTKKEVEEEQQISHFRKISG